MLSSLLKARTAGFCSVIAHVLTARIPMWWHCQSHCFYKVLGLSPTKACTHTHTGLLYRSPGSQGSSGVHGSLKQTKRDFIKIRLLEKLLLSRQILRKSVQCHYMTFVDNSLGGKEPSIFFSICPVFLRPTKCSQTAGAHRFSWISYFRNSSLFFPLHSPDWFCESYHSPLLLLRLKESSWKISNTSENCSRKCRQNPKIQKGDNRW